MEEIINTLTCPITLDIIEDPVQLPCCGKSVSRIPLKNTFKVIKNCPLCRKDLSSFDIDNAPTNRTLSAIVEAIKLSHSHKVIKDHQWLSNFEWIDQKNPYIGKLSLNIIRCIRLILRYFVFTFRLYILKLYVDFYSLSFSLILFYKVICDIFN